MVFRNEGMLLGSKVLRGVLVGALLFLALWFLRKTGKW